MLDLTSDTLNRIINYFMVACSDSDNRLIFNLISKPVLSHKVLSIHLGLVV